MSYFDTHPSDKYIFQTTEVAAGTLRIYTKNTPYKKWIVCLYVPGNKNAILTRTFPDLDDVVSYCVSACNICPTLIVDIRVKDFLKCDDDRYLFSHIKPCVQEVRMIKSGVPCRSKLR